MRPSVLCTLPIIIILILPCVLGLCERQLHVSVLPEGGEILPESILTGNFTLFDGVNATYGALFPDAPAGNFFINATTGSFLFTPNTSMAETRILFYALTPDGCVGSLLVPFTFLHPPPYNATPSDDIVLIREGRPMLFSISTSAMIGDWILNNKTILAENNTYIFRPDYNGAGDYNLSVFFMDEHNITANKKWHLTVQDVNREPIQVATIPNIIVPIHEEMVLNLSHYFIDPDRTALLYTMTFQEPYGVAANVTARIEGDQFMLQGISPGKEFILFTATDINGASLTGVAAEFHIDPTVVDRRKPFCGDGLCILDEYCGSCLLDCGACDAPKCTPQWVCGEWGACQPPGYQYRKCMIANGCENESEKPPEAQRCDYNATCFDKLRNGNESGVDCGGSCAPCPTCDDGIMNQGEFDVDCGGPCASCPTCDDLLRNQDESDIDCGGGCSACFPGKRCANDKDCDSANCDKGMCVAATCYDLIRNQGEKSVDCGGPCPPCPTCNDKVQNQGESGVDCGGPCDVCPACDDEIRNQGEEFVDCGGPCRRCTLRDEFAAFFVAIRWIIIIILLLCIAYFLRIILLSRFVFLFKNNKTIHFFYEDAQTYALIKFWSGITHPFRFSRQRDLAEMVRQTERELMSLRSLPSGTLKNEVTSKLRSLYANLFGLPVGFEFEHLVTSARQSKMPFTTKVIILKNTKHLALLELTRLFENGEYALDEALKNLQDLERAF